MIITRLNIMKNNKIDYNEMSEVLKAIVTNYSQGNRLI